LGNKLPLKLITLIGLFLITCIFVWGFGDGPSKVEKPAIQEYLAQIDGYDVIRNIQLPSGAYDMLSLDDYVYTDFDGPGGSVNLYIGYYYSPNKAYAAHSPLICYKSQGWRVTRQPVSGSLMVNGQRIIYEAIVTESERRKELVLYWYQARLRTNSKVYRNKISMAVNRLMYKNDQHAFVRVSARFGNASYDEVMARIVRFIEAFYPSFIQFVQEGDAVIRE
jgi:EpsI family protein